MVVEGRLLISIMFSSVLAMDSSRMVEEGGEDSEDSCGWRRGND